MSIGGHPIFQLLLLVLGRLQRSSSVDHRRAEEQGAEVFLGSGILSEGPTTLAPVLLVVNSLNKAPLTLSREDELPWQRSNKHSRAYQPVSGTGRYQEPLLR